MILVGDVIVFPWCVDDSFGFEEGLAPFSHRLVHLSNEFSSCHQPDRVTKLDPGNGSLFCEDFKRKVDDTQIWFQVRIDQDLSVSLSFFFLNRSYEG